jgi:hypothetical protein
MVYAWIGMLGLVAVVKPLDVHREQPRSPLCFEGLACFHPSCLEETLSSSLRLPLDGSQSGVRDSACSNRTAKGHLVDSARRKLGMPLTSVYENLNSTEPDVRSRLYSTPNINTEKAEPQLQMHSHSHRKAVHSWLSERESKASTMYYVAADTQDVVRAAVFIGCQRRFHRPVLKHAQSRHRKTVSMVAKIELFQ